MFKSLKSLVKILDLKKEHFYLQKGLIWYITTNASKLFTSNS